MIWNGLALFLVFIVPMALAGAVVAGVLELWFRFCQRKPPAS